MAELDGQAAFLGFPPGFLWGAATAAHQVEGGNRQNDWWRLEEEGLLPHRSGEACRHYELYERDFDLAAGMGHNAHRLSLEWSRIEPAPGQFDEAAIDHYKAVLDALQRRGLEPLLTLHHFTNPAWLADRGGWLQRRNVDHFERYARHVVGRLKDRVRFWITVNEPTVYAKYAYVLGHFPPCRTGSWLSALRVTMNMCRAHRLAYRVIHEARPDAMVSFAHSAPYVMPCAPGRALDRAASSARDFFLNRLCFMMASEGGRPLLDYVALNYYTRMVVRWAPRGKAVLFGEDCREDHHGQPRRYSDMGAEIYPEGLRRMIARLSRYGRPIIVTENGVDTQDDAVRDAYLVDHLRQLGLALQDGHDVRGYLHWSLMDNYEWALGTTARFGLAETDFATQARTPRPAAGLFAEVCRANGLSLSPEKATESA